MAENEILARDSEYARELERGIDVLSRKITQLRDANWRSMMAFILANGGSIRVSKKILSELNPEDEIAEYQDPTTGDYVYTVVIHPRK